MPQDPDSFLPMHIRVHNQENQINADPVPEHR
jgi:hypothetical protein